MSSYFIVGAGRSATTALLTALELSNEAVCLSEPTSNLNEESRWKYEGFAYNPYLILARAVGPRLAKGLDQAGIYVEKQISLVPFMRELHAMYGAKFIIPYRDGREVVTSLINWHHNIFPIVYREARDAVSISEKARAVEASVIAAGNYDPFDYSLPRPVKGDPQFGRWATLDHFEMCCWYWNAVYDRVFEEVAALPTSAYTFVDVASLSVERIAEIYAFCGLTDFDAAKIRAVLERGVNSFDERSGKGAKTFPHWQDWDEPRLMRYFDLCWRNHRRLGLSDGPTRPVPTSFGQFWRSKGVDLAWYDKIFEYRRPSHDVFKSWVVAQAADGSLTSALEIGVGTSDHYRGDVFTGWRFTGVDLLPEVVEWLQAHAEEGQTFVAADITRNSLDGLEADLVYSHASIDNVPDVDAFLASAAKLARKVLFISNYRGYFPELRNHRIHFDTETNVAFNDLSAGAMKETVEALGFATVAVVPVLTGRDDITEETVLVAARDAMRLDELLRGVAIGRDFKPYVALDGAGATEGLARQVNQACFYYSDADTGLADELASFERVVADLKRLDRPLLPLRRYAVERHRDQRAIGLRVDIDDDLVAALAMAQIAARHGVSLSFYILPTAPYYGSFEAGTFVRNPAVADFARAIQHHGHEVGLHVDALHYYREHGIDGAGAVVAELAWLRDRGVLIDGVTGHNCASFYGAENVEIFAQYAYSKRSLLGRDGLYCPLGALDGEALGILYEGSFFTPPQDICETDHPFVSGSGPSGYVTSAAWMRRYLIDNPYLVYGAEINIWVTGRDRWLFAGRKADERTYLRDKTWTQIAKLLAERPPASTLLVLHPNYFGRRRAAEEAPYGADGRPVVLRFS